MIEGGRLPGCGGVACRAVRPILAAVMIISRMAGKAGCRRTFELHILMATSTESGGVCACQLED